MNALINGLATLPEWALYPSLSAVAASETVFPAMAPASAIWYGAIAWLGFRSGQNLDELQMLIGSATRTSGSIAIAIVLLGGGILWWRRPRAATQ